MRAVFLLLLLNFLHVSASLFRTTYLSSAHTSHPILSRSILAPSCVGDDLRNVNRVLTALNALARGATALVNPVRGDQDPPVREIFDAAFGVRNDEANRRVIGQRLWELYLETNRDVGSVTIECRFCPRRRRRGLDVFAVSQQPNVIRLVCPIPSS